MSGSVSGLAFQTLRTKKTVNGLESDRSLLRMLIFLSAVSLERSVFEDSGDVL